jgi:hypothetical protein
MSTATAGRTSPPAPASRSRGPSQNGSATVWSGATGKPIRTWQGELPDALFGHWVMPVPDLDHDGLSDVVIAAPSRPIRR